MLDYSFTCRQFVSGVTNLIETFVILMQFWNCFLIVVCGDSNNMQHHGDIVA